LANIAFVSLYDRNANGLRLLSVNLKQHGHRCSIIFLKRYELNYEPIADIEEGEFAWLGVNKSGKVFKYAVHSSITPVELDLLHQILAKLRPDVIGLTVNTPLRLQAMRVTRFIKEHFSAPVIWGGYEATINPTRCLEECDYVCVGEGDHTIMEVAESVDQGQSLEKVCNLAYLQNGRIMTTPIQVLEQDLSNYPRRDNSSEDKYFIDDNELIENYSRLNDRREGLYQAMGSRGCPYKCSYCCESSLKNLYAGQKFLRQRSPQDLVEELVKAKQQHGITGILFEDEVFGMNLKWLMEFIPLYKREVDLPFEAYIYPTRGVEKNLRLLKDGGLWKCTIALQSGSERIQKNVFQRVYNRGHFLNTVRLCKELDIVIHTDVITYNPYEEEDDLKKTLDVLIDMQGGFHMAINKLFVLPGTKLAEQMERDGIEIGKSGKDILFKYYCRLFWIATFFRRSRNVIRIIEKAGFFRTYPKLLNPKVIESVLPKSLARVLLPQSVIHVLRRCRIMLLHTISRGNG